MGLQAPALTKANSLANLQLRLPAVVIGGGLTDHRYGDRDAAYLCSAGGKALDRYDRLVPKVGEQAIWANLDEEERGIIETW